ncbi:MAG: hypothetical protein JW883_15790 [Deltaproteobacteria bacterium]|nr:hypothetical protein [Deltaproteobacteria bacterium]
MVELNAYQKSELRRKYEKLDPTHQGGLRRPIHNPALQQLETEEILGIFQENEQDPQKWQTFTDLEGHIRNLATLRRMGVRRSF